MGLTLASPKPSSGEGGLIESSRRTGEPSVDHTEDLSDDSALLERIVARDARSVSVLYDRHARLLFNLALRIRRDRADAEDLLQEVFVAV